MTTEQPDPAIVLVEDEPDILVILCRLMRDIQGDYTIVTVNGGAEALAQVERRRVPLLITDYEMPNMDGLQLTKVVKAVSPETRVVLITDVSTSDLEQRASQAGVDYYLPMPFQLIEFEAIVRSILGSGRTTPNV